MSLTNRLNELRELAAPLESSSATRVARLQQAGEHAERFLESLPEREVYGAAGPREDAIDAFAISAEPEPFGEALRILDQYVDGIGHNLGSSRFFAYIPSGGLHDAAIADYLAAVSNRYAGVGAAAAREANNIKSADVPSVVVYLTTHTHHTFRKALHVGGLGECVIREIPLDAKMRMDCDRLQESIRQDQNAGLQPWLIGASAGTTDTGAVDPLDRIADIAAESNVWMHVDAAYGGAFALCDDGRRRLKGIERSDSLILDPHKGFFLPCGIGVVLVRNGQQLYDAYHARGTYMQDVAGDTERSPCDYSAELTRPTRALRFWLPFKVHGSGAFAAALEEKLLLAEYFYDECGEVPGIKLGPRPDLSIVTFRFCPASTNADVATRSLLKAIHNDGRVFMTSTTIAGDYTIRMAILTYHTHLEDIDLALQVIKECAATISRA